MPRSIRRASRFRLLPPLPPGEGRGEGAREIESRPIARTPPHPDLLPEGEGTRARVFATISVVLSAWLMLILILLALLLLLCAAGVFGMANMLLKPLRMTDGRATFVLQRLSP